MSTAITATYEQGSAFAGLVGTFGSLATASEWAAHWEGVASTPIPVPVSPRRVVSTLRAQGVEQLLAVEAELEALTYRLETSPMFAGANGLAAQEANRVLRSLGAAIRTITTATSSREEA